MHILMVSDFYHPLLGGVEQHVRTLSTELCRLGHRVTVATLAVEGLAENDVDGEVRVVRVKSSTQRFATLFSQPRTWAPPMTDPETFVALRRVVGDIRPDVVHGHDWMSRSLFPRASASPPFVSSLHYYTRSCARKDLLQRGQPCTGPGVAKCLSCAVEHYGALKGTVTATGSAVGRLLEDRSVSAHIAVSRATALGNGLDPGADDVFVIPNFLPSDGSSSAPVAAQVERNLEELPTGPFLMYVGDFRAIKGFDLLLEAYERSNTSMPLVVVGKRWPETPDRLPPGVVMFEEWQNASVRAAFERAAFAVVPSMWEEPFGIVAIEALAAGTPVIAADVGGLRDIVDVRGPATATGIRFPRGDAEALTAAIELLAVDADLRGRFVANTASAAARYRAETVVPEIVDVYEAVRR